MTRDSLSWWLALALAVLGYLVTAQKPPIEWGYMEWLQALTFVLAWLSGKLATSPLSISSAGRDAYLGLKK